MTRARSSAPDIANFGEAMTRRFRISKGQHLGELVDDVEELESFARQNGLGRYHVDEISSDPLPSGHTSRRWGVGFKDKNGTIAIEPDPWT
jgi:hypothetical protein